MTLAAVPAEGLFDTVAGLPMHPLVVHAAVVLLPLAALGLIVIVLVPRWRRPFGWLTMAGLAVGTVAAFVAKESGEALAERVGEPEEHAELGDVLPLVAVALFVVALAWFLLDRRATAAGRASGAGVTILGIIAAIAAIGTIGLTVAVGHSGAEAVWAGKVRATSSESASQHQPSQQLEGRAVRTLAAGSSAVAAPASHSISPAVKRYTRAQVRRHNTAGDCWTIIGRSVYNLTDWVNRHPGGASRILALCGRDGTQAFRAQHGGQSRPAGELAAFRIGRLATTTTA